MRHQPIMQQLQSETIWLRYFNQTLFEQGIITEAQRNAMLLRIKARKVSTLKTR